jgi:uncharacterized protein
VSQLADQFVKDPTDVVKVGQKVQVTVLEVDLTRRRIGLSMRRKPDAVPVRRSNSGAEKGAPPPRPAPARPPATDWFTLAMNRATQAKAQRGAHEDD